MEVEPGDQLARAVLHDFSHALGLAPGGLQAQGPRRRLQGLGEAEEVLLSYAEELSCASASSNDRLTAPLLGVLREQALAAAAVSTPASVWHALLRLTAAAAPGAQQTEQALWAEVAAALLAAPEPGPGEALVARLEAARGALPPILERAGLTAPPARAPAAAAAAATAAVAAAAVDPRGALLAALLLHLFPIAAGPEGGHADTAGAAAAQCLLGLAGAGGLSLASRSASDDRVVREAMQQAFAAVVATLQSPSVQRRMGAAGGSAEASCCRRAFAFLQLFKQGPPAVADQWWGVFAATARQLAAAVERAGPAAAKQPPLAPLVRAFFNSETAAALAHTLLAIPLPAAAAAREPKPKSAKRGGGGGGGKQGGGKQGGGILPKQGWAAAYEACLAHDPPALLLGAAEVLRPDASYALNDRVAAVQGEKERLGREAAAAPASVKNPLRACSAGLSWRQGSLCPDRPCARSDGASDGPLPGSQRPGRGGAPGAMAAAGAGPPPAGAHAGRPVGLCAWVVGGGCVGGCFIFFLSG